MSREESRWSASERSERLTWILSIIAPIALLLAAVPLIGALERAVDRVYGVERRTTCVVSMHSPTDEDGRPANVCWISDPGSD